ncbi:hydroxycarboxylic acid receptor 2 [Xenopus tropicalis]|uniref:Hydroxycarboxylic acid receptor 2 n=1 Tax=Xenopus tropicalis TaxID=8364 RepID=A0A8J0SW92_XENTR|nr:hydroxycarboxylic acid receptor 2 [Xenopus tropicalis]|eukprot:XP_012824453.1 PREDICTED: hydroxycarboxylic acid receptor 2-like [Xenopus tropicalis]
MSNSCCVFEAPILDQVLPPVLLFEFVLGLVGNSIGLWMICRQVKSWKPYSVYLFSLTLADFLVLFSVLFRADYYMRKKDWIYGDMPCRICLFTISACRSAGIIFLTIIAIDRYCKILFPFHRVNSITVKEAGIFCFLMWLGILVLYSYILTGSHSVKMDNSTQCESFQICPKNFSLADLHDGLYILMSIGSLVIMSYSTVCIAQHLKNNTIDKDGKIRRAVRCVLSITLVYTVCYLPSTLVRISVWMLKLQKHGDCAAYTDASLAFYATICFTYFYSMLNPIVYYFSSTSPSHFNQTLLAKICCRKCSYCCEN